MIAGFNFNEAAAFLTFNPADTSPPPATVPGTSGLACGVKNEAK